MTYFNLLLPVIWAIVATLIGSILYKTTTAVFDKITRTEATSVKLRLTGSVVIAGLAFYAMKLATPSNLQAPGMTVVVSNELNAALEGGIEAEGKLLELEACVNTGSQSGCEPQVVNVRQTIHALNERLAHVK